MTVWEAGTRLTEAFVAPWSKLLRHSNSANFSMDLEFLDWEQAHGRPSRAVRYEDGGGCAVVFRHTPSGWQSGWPWRSQVVPDRWNLDGRAWPAPGPLRHALRSCARAAGIHHARIFLPIEAVLEETAYLAGSTISRRLDVAEDELFRGMDHNKRRNLKQALQAGYEVTEARTQEDFLAFATLQVATEIRRGAPRRRLPVTPGTGEAWREWELPWTWLLLARRAGRIEAGMGFGRFPSGILDCRTNASTPEARQLGANVLLAWEAIRRGRLAGYRRVNWCGNTIFKRGLGGERTSMMCVLDGDPMWHVPDALEVRWHQARRQVAAHWKQMLERQVTRPAVLPNGHRRGSRKAGATAASARPASSG